MADLGITTGGDVLGHVLALGTNDGGSFTPDGIAAAVEKVHEQIRIVSGEIFNAEPDVDDSFFARWSRYVVDFTSWKTEHSSWLSRAWNETRAELLDHLAKYHELRGEWVALLAQNGGETRSIAFEVKDAPKGTLEDLGKQLGLALKHVGIGLAVVVGVPLLGYVAWRMVRQ